MSYFNKAMESLCKFRPARYALAKGNKLSSLIPPPYRDLAADPMPRKILLVHAHPLKKSFTCAVAQSVADIAISSGHEIRRVSLYEEKWDPLLSAHEREVFGDYKDGLGRFGDDVNRSVSDLQWCDTLIFVYPTWWFNTPAILKGWLDRVLVPGGAFTLPDGGNAALASETGLVPLLTNIKRVAGFSTYGCTRYITLKWGDNGRNMIGSALRPLFAKDCVLYWHGLYDMDKCGEAGRTEYLKEVKDIVATKL